MVERRKHTRVKPDSSSSIEIMLIGKEFSGVMQPEDISVGGIRFEIIDKFDELKELTPGTRLPFVISLDQSTPFRGNGTIRKSETTGPHSGMLAMEFTELDPEDIIEIENYVTIQQYRDGIKSPSRQED